MNPVQLGAWVSLVKPAQQVHPDQPVQPGQPVRSGQMVYLGPPGTREIMVPLVKMVSLDQWVNQVLQDPLETQDCRVHKDHLVQQGKLGLQDLLDHPDHEDNKDQRVQQAR